MKKRNLVLLVSLAVFAGFVFWLTVSLKVGTASTGYGAAFYPRFLLGVLLILMGILLVQTLTGKTGESEIEKETPREIKNAAFFLVLIILYGLLLSKLGFIIDSLVFLLIGMKVLGGSWKTSVISAVVTVAVLYGLFAIGFKVMLPMGLLGGVL